MADPMTQSQQISSSQGLNDGRSKDSKFNDSFFSSSPVSLIQSPQDNRVALDSEKPSEAVATSLRFSSQPSSFSPGTYGNESSDSPSGTKIRSFQEKLELFESSLASQKQDSSPIKVSPVSERIKALEALAAKKNDSDWSDGGFSHFKERHYEKSPTEVHGVSYRSSVKKKPTPTEQDSPESPFEILGDTRRGSDFEDTADWMRAHLPPAPNFNIDETDFDEMKQSSVMQENPGKDAKSKATEAPDVPGSFVGVPAEFMDTPAEVTNQTTDSTQSKQDSIEDESEFDLRFLPTAYMWDKQEKTDANAHKSPDISETADLEVAASPAVSAGFESPSLALVSHVDSGANHGDKEPAETLDVDSSGESDDTVIEDLNGPAAGTDALECSPSTNKETLSHEQEKPVIQVPIINVIETGEQVLSDYEVEYDDDDYDYEQKYQIQEEPTREESQSPEEHSEVLKSVIEDAPPTREDISSHAVPANSDSDYSSQDKLIKDSISEDTIKQTSLDSESPGSEDLQVQSAVSSNSAETFGEPVNVVETDKAAKVIAHPPPNHNDLSNEVESSDIDTYLDHYTNENLVDDQLNSGVFTENDGEADESVAFDPCQHSQTNTIFGQQSYEETVVDQFDESLPESKMNHNRSEPEPSPAAISADVHVEHLASQNKMPCFETEDQKVVVGSLDTKAASGSFSLTEEDNITQPESILSPIQKNTPAPFPSFHDDPSSKMTEDIIDLDITKGTEETNSEQGEVIQRDSSESQETQEILSKPETESPATEAADSFVEFMRECLKSQQDEESKDLNRGHRRKEPISASPSSPARVMDLVQDEHLTISALKELGSSQEEEDETNTCNKTISVYFKDDASQTSSKSKAISSPSTAPCLPNEYQSDASLTREVEAIDIWVAEAYHLAEHVLAVILTHLSVHDLVYWRDPKKSGIVFGTSLLLLLSLAAFSVISVISYLLLALLCVTISFRIYKSVIQAVQKTNEGHPFKELMEKDVSLPPETFRKNVDVSLTYINRALKQLSRLFLVEDLVDSLKLAVVMWLLTYVGAVFNGITILILVDILAFTVPPLYEKYKTQIDRYIGMARNHINTAVTKIQEKLPKAAKRNKTE